ncbi:hypothetical protein FQR65_LT18201 [Abscondita terminalis]|nr:hypothetical protein FQR65_LT18201 [Abscondita terminalis]
MIDLKTLGIYSLSLVLSGSLFAADADFLKNKLEKEGYNFVKKIDAPEGMEGWTGYKDEYPSTLFIAKDQKHYIVGDLFDASGKNLTEQAINTHVKGAVLDEIWKSLEKSTWIQDGDTNAKKIVYVFNDPNCPYCHTFWQQARPFVASGKVQLRHIMVGVIRPSSKGQAATILNSANPAEIFKQLILPSGCSQAHRIDRAYKSHAIVAQLSPSHLKQGENRFWWLHAPVPVLKLAKVIIELFS